MHAVQLTHLLHHKHCMDDEDVEALSARRSALGALLLGPWFPLRLHQEALRRANARQRRWIVAELLANVIWVVLVFAVFNVAALKYHVVAMSIGQCLTAFFAVWTLHHHLDPLRFIA